MTGETNHETEDLLSFILDEEEWYATIYRNGPNIGRPPSPLPQLPDRFAGDDAPLELQEIVPKRDEALQNSGRDTLQPPSVVTSTSDANNRASFVFSTTASNSDSTVPTTETDHNVPLPGLFDDKTLPPVTGKDHGSFLPEMAVTRPAHPPQPLPQPATLQPQPQDDQTSRKKRTVSAAQKDNRKEVSDSGGNCAACMLLVKPCSSGDPCKRCKSKNIFALQSDQPNRSVSLKKPFDRCVRRIFGNINYFSNYFDELPQLELVHRPSAIGVYGLSEEELEFSRQICFENAFVNIDAFSTTIFAKLVGDIDNWYGKVVSCIWGEHGFADHAIRDTQLLEGQGGIALFIKTNIILANMDLAASSDADFFIRRQRISIELEGVRAYTAMHAFALLENELRSSNFRKEESLDTKVAVINLVSGLFEQVLIQYEHVSPPGVSSISDEAFQDLKVLVRTLWNWLRFCIKATFHGDSARLLKLISGSDERALLQLDYWRELHNTVSRAQEAEDTLSAQAAGPSSSRGKRQKTGARFLSASEKLNLATAWQYTSRAFTRMQLRLQRRLRETGPGLEYLQRFGDKCSYPEVSNSSPSQSEDGATPAGYTQDLFRVDRQTSSQW